ncbi:MULTISPECIES: thiamine phosphate synthase [Sphingobacterium]|uniref:Thiamine phosphate synthase n=1 Tax=Sphingobacterium populi TaxID=1812824 RepID=A0ABW5U8Y6_9SPHI|nr:thiamine phosphate synthase [Sphingobacterium sp. CFCC 11742]
MMIVLTPEYAADQEIETVIRLLDAGLDLLHIRKYDYSIEQTATYIRRIPSYYHGKLVLHEHHELASTFDLKHLHMSETMRQEWSAKPLPQGIQFSTSTHDISSFNQLDNRWHYAFLSPFYPSISKPGYGSSSNMLQQTSKRTNQSVRLIALGGMNTTNIAATLSADVDGIALLGAIWESDNPIQTFEDCCTAASTTPLLFKK